MKYTLRQLEIFAAVARHESVSRAAAELALSQSATSTALGELERQFDTQLFDRIGKALRQPDRSALRGSPALEEQIVLDGVAAHHPATLGWDDFNGSH